MATRAVAKLVNGELVTEAVVLSVEEEDAMNAEWAANELPDAINNKVSDIKREALSRIQAVMPAITDFDVLELVREQWLSIAPAARDATISFQQMIDVYQAGRAAIVVVKAMNVAATVNAYDAVNTPVWPV